MGRTRRPTTAAEARSPRLGAHDLMDRQMGPLQWGLGPWRTPCGSPSSFRHGWQRRANPRNTRARTSLGCPREARFQASRGQRRLHKTKALRGREAGQSQMLRAPSDPLLKRGGPARPRGQEVQAAEFADLTAKLNRHSKATSMLESRSFSASLVRSTLLLLLAAPVTWEKVLMASLCARGQLLLASPLARGC